MQFYYGSYQHADSSVSFTNIARTVIRGATQRAHLLRVTWGLRGKLISQVSQADLFAQLTSLQNAYSVDGNGAGLAGSPFTINAAQALGGVRVTSPVSHEGIKGAEGVTYLYYTIGLEADFLIASGSTILEFNETLTFTDNLGLPLTVERVPQNGMPFLQTVSTNSWFYATQQGKLSQPGPNPPAMAPIFPGALRTASNSAKQITYTSPEMIRGNPVKYGVTWKYEFISPTPLIAWPNVLG